MPALSKVVSVGCC